MPETSSNNKRIAQNTLFMYLRLLVIMGVGLYTSRVILQVLGVENYGIYNVVGGVVVLFTFLNAAMTSSTQRYLSYELGKKDGDVALIYRTCFYIHVGIAVFILLLSETVGLWFLNTQMNFPEGRMAAVNWVYQFSVLSCIINIVRVPYHAAIIAYERMFFFAYTGILEAILKLLIVYILVLFPVDKVILFAALIAGLSLIVNIIYTYYVHFIIGNLSLIGYNDRKKYKELLSFSSWTLFGGVANIGIQQGLNIVINLFYGVTVNAAVGIANQVNSHITTFVSGFQQALNPQLTKSEAEGNRERQYSLIYKSARFSFFIMFILACPVMINLDYILTLWLGEFPPYTTVICCTIIIGALIETLSGPLWVSVYATGQIKRYQIVISLLLLLNLPLSYLVGSFNCSPEIMYIIRNGIYVICLLVRLCFLQKLISLDLRGFFRKVIRPIIAIVLLIIIPFYVFPKDIVVADDFLHFLAVSFSVVIYSIFLIELIGLNKSERKTIHNIILGKILKKR